MPDVYKECGEAHNKDVFKVDILCAQAKPGFFFSTATRQDIGKPSAR
jgi:hypothetical protein